MDEKEVMKREGWNGWEDGMECNGKGKKGKQRDRTGWDIYLNMYKFNFLRFFSNITI